MTLKLLIGDVLAITEATRCTGHGGQHFCCACTNAIHPRSVIWKYRGDHEGLVHGTCVDFSKFRLHSDGTIKATLARLAQASRDESRKALEQLEKDHGFHHDPESFLVDPHLNINFISVLSFDWMHVYLINGIYIPLKSTTCLMRWRKRSTFSKSSLGIVLHGGGQKHMQKPAILVTASEV